MKKVSRVLSDYIGLKSWALRILPESRSWRKVVAIALLDDRFSCCRRRSWLFARKETIALLKKQGK